MARVDIRIDITSDIKDETAKCLFYFFMLFQYYVLIYVMSIYRRVVYKHTMLLFYTSSIISNQFLLYDRNHESQKFCGS